MVNLGKMERERERERERKTDRTQRYRTGYGETVNKSRPVRF